MLATIIWLEIALFALGTSIIRDTSYLALESAANRDCMPDKGAFPVPKGVAQPVSMAIKSVKMMKLDFMEFPIGFGGWIGRRGCLCNSLMNKGLDPHLYV
jgi:hypothetical protein